MARKNPKISSLPTIMKPKVQKEKGEIEKTKIRNLCLKT
jgi:hypothetical protein